MNTTSKTVVARIETPAGRDESATTYVTMIDLDTDEAAREMVKFTRFEAFLGTNLVRFLITMGQVLNQ